MQNTLAYVEELTSLVSTKYFSHFRDLKKLSIDNINLKTGTLTETDIDLAGAIPIQKAEFQKPVLQLSILPDTHPLLQVMTTCHTLIKLNDQLNGYSIDRKMFDAAKWNFANGPAGVNSDYWV